MNGEIKFAKRLPPPVIERKKRRPVVQKCETTTLASSVSPSVAQDNLKPPLDSLFDRLEQLERAESAAAAAVSNVSGSSAQNVRRDQLLKRQISIQKLRRTTKLANEGNPLHEAAGSLLCLPDSVLEIVCNCLSLQSLGRLAQTCCKLRRFLNSDADLLFPTSGSLIWRDLAFKMFPGDWHEDFLYKDVFAGQVVMYRLSLRKRIEHRRRAQEHAAAAAAAVAKGADVQEAASTSVAVGGRNGWSGGSSRKTTCYLCGGNATLVTAQRNVRIVVYMHCAQCGASGILSKDQGF